MNEDAVWVDSHCHLEMLKEDVEVALEKSNRTGLKFCITIGTDYTSNQKLCQYCDTFPNVFGTLGFHPHGASKVKQEHLDHAKTEIEQNQKIVAVGECGYDLYYEHSDRKVQEKVFDAQLELASEVNLPVIIHSRDADSQTREMLESHRRQDLEGVVHCFTSHIEQARYYLDLGFYLSFNGICTFPQADTVREVLKFVPLDRVLLETDAPYLSPVPYRGKPNFPGRVSIVGHYIASLLGIPEEKLADQVLQNTKTLFQRIDYEN